MTKTSIVQRLLEEKHITAEEAVVLLMEKEKEFTWPVVPIPLQPFQPYSPYPPMPHPYSPVWCMTSTGSNENTTSQS